MSTILPPVVTGFGICEETVSSWTVVKKNASQKLCTAQPAVASLVAPEVPELLADRGHGAILRAPSDVGSPDDRPPRPLRGFTTLDGTEQPRLDALRGG
jgi:hypothetical protein